MATNFKIIEMFMNASPCYTNSKRITPRGVVTHSTATPGAKHTNFYNLWNQTNPTQVSITLLMTQASINCFQKIDVPGTLALPQMIIISVMKSANPVHSNIMVSGNAWEIIIPAHLKILRISTTFMKKRYG